MSFSAFPVDYQRLFRALPDNFLLIAPDADATIVDNTDSHVTVSLKSREAAVGKPFFEAFPATDEESARIIRESHEHVRRHREAHTMPLIRYDLPDPAAEGGLQELYWEATHYPILSESGELEFILQRTQDVTERHLAELRSQQMQQALDEQNERTRFILESLPVMIWTATPSGERDFFNSRWLQFTGRPQEEQTGWDWLSNLHPDDQQRVRTTWQASVDTAQSYQVEYRLRRHDGQYRWVLVRALPRLSAAGDLLMWVGCGTDIHDQKQMVQELLEQNEQQALLSDQAYEAFQRVQQQRETFYSLFMHTPAMICMLRGPEHHYEFVNPEYQRLFPGRQLLGHTVADALPELANQGILDLLDNVYSTGQPFIGEEIRVDLHNQAGQLQARYFNFTYQRIEESGQTPGIYVFAYDVTDLLQARQKLETPGPDAQ
ncbi:PAS domain-containing protein [Hymenobacter endophyticus]|uniref:histidine kinase n=1 Tax=Hymenobacter endophyticus TaxID=3076335 RepID=A0ABU3TM91_9BACT|nr:PAS domain-containing protein [Hymenobacter endophyticus]MDU0372489.1 PAS domain-containing protein [Hymenobacter endophyticus]